MEPQKRSRLDKQHYRIFVPGKGSQMRSKDDMGQSQAMGLTVVGVTISLVLWSGFARVAQSNERVARSNERLAASKERLAESNMHLATAMNAQRIHASERGLNKRSARVYSLYGKTHVSLTPTQQAPPLPPPVNLFLPPSKNPFAKVPRPHALVADPRVRGPLLSFNPRFPGRPRPWIKPGRVIVHEAQDRQARP